MHQINRIIAHYLTIVVRARVQEFCTWRGSSLSRHTYKTIRGRLHGNKRLYVEPLFTLVEIALKYDIDPQRLVESIIRAWTNHRDQCGPLTITYRDIKATDTAMFLITDQETVVSQFPIKTKVLENPTRFKQHLQHVPVVEIHKHYRHEVPPYQTISQLRNKMKHVNLNATIIEITPVKRVPTRFGKWANLTNIQIADDTGSIQLSLWDNQVQTLQINDIITITNGYVTRYQGELQLHLGRKGSIIKLKN